MHKYKYLLFLFLLPFLQCKTKFCPPDTKLGSLQLEDQTISYIPYHGGEILNFINQDGKTMELIAPQGRQLLKDKLCVETICTEADFNGTSTCKYYEAEAQQFIFYNEDNTLVMDLLFYTQVYDPERNRFYDVMRLGLSYNESVTQAGILTKLRFGPPYKQAEMDVKNYMMGTPTLILNNQIFEDTWAHESDPLKFYFNREQGLLGFKFENEVWSLK